jgi:hypothetical protein
VPGLVEEARRLVLDPLTKVQQRQAREIGPRILRAVDPGCLGELTAPLTAESAPRTGDRR